MGGRGKRKPLVPPPMASLRRARAVTSSFHRLSAELAEASAAGRRSDAACLSQELEQLGGCAPVSPRRASKRRTECAATRRRAAYQEASALTTARHRTAKFVFAALTRHGLRPARGEPPLPLLEARALLRVNYISLTAPSRAGGRGEHATHLRALACHARHRPAQHTPPHRAARLLCARAGGAVRSRRVRHGTSLAPPLPLLSLTLRGGRC